MCLPISQGPNKKWSTPGVYLKSYQELGILTWEETSTFCISSKIKLKWEKLIPMLLGKYKLIQIELTFWIQALDLCMVWKYGHVFIPSFCSDLKGSAYSLMELQRTERLGRIFTFFQQDASFLLATHSKFVELWCSKKAPKLCPATCSVQQHIFIALHEPLKKKASGS